MIGSLPPIKGVSPYTLGLIKALSKKISIDFIGFRSIYPEFLYPGGTKDTDEIVPVIPNVRIHNMLTWFNPFSWICAGLRIQTSIVHAQWWSWVLAPIYATILSIAKIRGKRIILTIHNVKSHENGFTQSFCNMQVMRLADEYIVHSDANKRDLQKLLKTYKPIHVIPHGLIEMPKSPLSNSSVRKKYGFSKQDKILLFFGNIRPYKGLDVLLDAFRQIQDKQVKLIVAGQPWVDFAQYLSIIKKYRLEKRVSLFLRFIPAEQVAEFHKMADVVVYPYKHLESASGAMSVSLYYQKPIVTTGVAPLSEYIVDHQLIAHKKDSLDLVNKITICLKNNTIKRTRIKSVFSYKSISTKHLYIYNSFAK
jgi:glycosyltransferase involved in cell wall biosynthesis